MTAPHIKPCPFCGGKPYLANVEMVGCAYVVCTDCRAQGDDASRETAIAAWNRRADLPPKVRALEWVELGSSYRAAAPLFGNIRVEDYASGKWIILWSAPGISDTFTPGAHDTPEAAKAAAQADYEARILAALVQP